MIKIKNLDEAAAAIQTGMAEQKRLGVRGIGSKAALGRHETYDDVLDLSAMRGIIEYQPEELVLTLRAGTPMDEVEAVVVKAGQMLPFEAPDYSRLLAGGSAGSIGGVIAANLSGPRRLTAGAARDYLLGFQAVSGRGEFFRSGGKVMKNVTGYDLSKLICGSYGTLAIVDEITVKTLPCPETAVSLLLGFDGMQAAVTAVAGIFATPHEPHAAAILPANLAKAAGVDLDRAFVVVIRLEGIAVSVNDRAAHLLGGAFGAAGSSRLEAGPSRDLWKKIRDVDLLAGHGRSIWKASCAPASAPAILDVVQAAFDVEFYADWAGGLIWLAAPSGTAFAAALRAALADHGGGFAQLMVDAGGVDGSVAPFQPLLPAHAALHRRVKAAFDPMAVLNYGRMHDGI
jgi:glycolate oxidase FAD binding subunit